VRARDSRSISFSRLLQARRDLVGDAKPIPVSPRERGHFHPAVNYRVRDPRPSGGCAYRGLSQQSSECGGRFQRFTDERRISRWDSTRSSTAPEKRTLDPAAGLNNQRDVSTMWDHHSGERESRRVLALCAGTRFRSKIAHFPEYGIIAIPAPRWRFSMTREPPSHIFTRLVYHELRPTPVRQSKVAR
jgi:hypothetical protein